MEQTEGQYGLWDAIRKLVSDDQCCRSEHEDGRVIESIGDYQNGKCVHRVLYSDGSSLITNYFKGQEDGEYVYINSHGNKTITNYRNGEEVDSNGEVIGSDSEPEDDED